VESQKGNVFYIGHIDWRKTKQYKIFVQSEKSSEIAGEE
jgi:hypothetical protein